MAIKEVQCGMWRVCVYSRESHTNPSWRCFTRAPSQHAAVIRAISSCDVKIGRLTVESAEGLATEESIHYL